MEHYAESPCSLAPEVSVGCQLYLVLSGCLFPPPCLGLQLSPGALQILTEPHHLPLQTQLLTVLLLSKARKRCEKLLGATLGIPEEGDREMYMKDAQENWLRGYIIITVVLIIGGPLMHISDSDIIYYIISQFTI